MADGFVRERDAGGREIFHKSPGACQGGWILFSGVVSCLLVAVCCACAARLARGGGGSQDNLITSSSRMDFCSANT